MWKRKRRGENSKNQEMISAREKNQGKNEGEGEEEKKKREREREKKKKEREREPKSRMQSKMKKNIVAAKHPKPCSIYNFHYVGAQENHNSCCKSTSCGDENTFHIRVEHKEGEH